MALSVKFDIPIWVLQLCGVCASSYLTGVRGQGPGGRGEEKQSKIPTVWSAGVLA